MSLVVLGADRVESGVLFKQRVGSDSISSCRIESAADSSTCDALTTTLRAFSPKISPLRAGPFHAVVSDRWLRWSTLPWSDALLRESSAQTQYQTQFRMTWGGGISEWVFAVDDAPYGEPRLLAGMPRELLDALQAWAGARHGYLAGVRPLSVAVWDKVKSTIRAASYGLCVVESQVLTLMVVLDGLPVHVASYSWTDHWAAELERQWKRLRLREAGWKMVEDVYTLDLTGGGNGAAQQLGFVKMLDLPAGISYESGQTLLAVAYASAYDKSALDFAPRAASCNGWRLGLLTAGVALVALTGWQLWQTLDRVAEVQRDVARYTVRPVAPEKAPSANQLREREARVRAVNEAIQQINVPIGALLLAAQPPQDTHVALLGLDVLSSPPAAGGAALKITAEAPSGAAMADYVAYLAQKPPFVAAYLLRHELMQERSGYLYRFTVEVTWRQ